MNKQPAKVRQKIVSAEVARREDALELAQILYDVYIEQSTDENADNEQEFIDHNND